MVGSGHKMKGCSALANNWRPSDPQLKLDPWKQK